MMSNAIVVVIYANRQELNCSRRASGYFTIIGDKAPPATRGSSEFARVGYHVVILTPEMAGTVGV